MNDPAPSLKLPPGVITGTNLRRLYEHAKVHHYAIPSFRVASWAACRIVLDAARFSQSPVAIRLTYGGTVDGAPESAVTEAICLAHAIRALARLYRVVVVLETETRCTNKLASWYLPLLEASETFFRENGCHEPLFSSHFLETLDIWDSSETIAMARQFLSRMSKSRTWLHVKLSKVSDETWRYAHTQLQSRSYNFSLAMDVSTWKQAKQRKKHLQLIKDSQSFVVLDHSENAVYPNASFHGWENSAATSGMAYLARSKEWGNVVQVQIPHDIPYLKEDQLVLNSSLPIATRVSGRGTDETTGKAVRGRDWIQERKEQKFQLFLSSMNHCGSTGRGTRSDQEIVKPQQLLFRDAASAGSRWWWLWPTNNSKRLALTGVLLLSLLWHASNILLSSEQNFQEY